MLSMRAESSKSVSLLGPSMRLWASMSTELSVMVKDNCAGIQMQRGRKVDWDLFVRLMVASQSGKDAWFDSDYEASLRAEDAFL